MIMLQISASHGPLECALAVGKAFARFSQEALKEKVDVDVLELAPASRAGCYVSVLLALSGEQAEHLANSWAGTLQWICQSPYRPHHERKNWFIGVAVYHEQQSVAQSEIHFESCRASGPGGQHVNKTDSAIRATHVASGISVKVQSQRSQHANKRLATILIERKLLEMAEQAQGEQRALRRIAHHQVERGAAKRVFRGERFEPVS